jgi:hypothetical protein
MAWILRQPWDKVEKHMFMCPNICYQKAQSLILEFVASTIITIQIDLEKHSKF